MVTRRGRALQGWDNESHKLLGVRKAQGCRIEQCFVTTVNGNSSLKFALHFFLIKRKDSEGGEIWEVRPNK